MVRRIVLVALLVCLCSRVTFAQNNDDYGSDAGYGALAVAANLFYMPAKVVYALLGGLTGGLAYCLTVGDLDTAESVWSPSLGGTYVVTPAMLRGDQPVLFSGPSYSKN
jgi:hypothetical protein